MLRSMTGFGRAEGQLRGLRWVWELRAVNGKGLDIRLRMPQGYERLEQPVRKNIGKKLSRGNIQAVLTVGSSSELAPAALNQEMLGVVLSAINTIDSMSERAPSSAADILAIRGVLETVELSPDEEGLASIKSAMLDDLEAAIDGLVQNRQQEGRALAGVLVACLDKVQELTSRAEEDPSRTSHAIKTRLQKQLKEIEGMDGEFDRDRLHQEVALLATKADIREELDRLTAHTAAARILIQKGSPIGRKLDFLAQEFNREANTLCSKSNAVSLSETGVELKVTIDQFREQCLNVE
jgi:uncharacterized protein (TIGR00255 family)